MQMFQSPGRIALSLGPLTIYWYGILIAAAILFAYWFSVREAGRRGLSESHIDSMSFAVILAGILGARLYYVLFNIGQYARNPLEIFYIWEGGLAIHGALIGGALAYMMYCKRHTLKFLLYLDVIAPGILMAQAIGRWGNFFNSEAFGAPTGLPWKLYIPSENRPEEYAEFFFFHPAFLYESIWNFAGFLFLIWLNKKLFPHHAAQTPDAPAGPIFFAYLVWYSLGRFFIEFLRTDSLYMGPLRTAQVASILLIIIGIFGLYKTARRSMIMYNR